MHIVVHYHEIALKGHNRWRFIRRLAQNLQHCLADVGHARVAKLSGRLVVSFSNAVPWQLAEERLRRVFGVANFSRAHRHPLHVESLRPRLVETLRGETFATFRVHTRRAFKNFPQTSLEINRDLGDIIRRELQRKVNLDHPDLTVFVEVVPGEILFYFKKHAGLGGLPVGVTGLVLGLISGGIDSPVACFRMMRRGCTVTLLHFHSYPFHSKASQEKVEELAELLTQYQYHTTLVMVPFGEIQRQVMLAVPAPYRIVIYRRLMLRIAARLAEQEGAKALVTGESLAQVSSQTLENLTVIDRATEMPVLRPLIGMDKDEICAQARELGSYEISIQPDEDCCQLFMPERPVIACTLGEIARAESLLDVEALVGQGLAQVTRRFLSFPARSAPPIPRLEVGAVPAPAPRPAPPPTQLGDDRRQPQHRDGGSTGQDAAAPLPASHLPQV
ncbi:MAG: tRNA 4-thiouridine(8) synthase ThiI [Candidatus Tectomicrobia bacterium]|nr:tRNA 4-thiouridine(8) synthase ThiI [Candidatus Tectomicrobia bacterium]